MTTAMEVIQLESRVALPEYDRYVICQHMGWDYYTYEAQPPFFLEEVATFMLQESLKQKNGNKIEQNKPKSKGGISRF